jgi:hypothetical protein
MPLEKCSHLENQTPRDGPPVMPLSPPWSQVKQGRKNTTTTPRIAQKKRMPSRSTFPLPCLHDRLEKKSNHERHRAANLPRLQGRPRGAVQKHIPSSEASSYGPLLEKLSAGISSRAPTVGATSRARNQWAADRSQSEI